MQTSSNSGWRNGRSSEGIPSCSNATAWDNKGLLRKASGISWDGSISREIRSGRGKVNAKFFGDAGNLVFREGNEEESNEIILSNLAKDHSIDGKRLAQDIHPVLIPAPGGGGIKQVEVHWDVRRVDSLRCDRRDAHQFSPNSMSRRVIRYRRGTMESISMYSSRAW